MVVPEAIAEDANQIAKLDKRRRIELNEEERVKTDSSRSSKCGAWIQERRSLIVM